MNALEILKQRGFVQQCSDETELTELFSEQKITYYAGFDPTAESFHIGSLVPIMAMAHLQKCGHRPIAVIGGGTGLIGDPSGKTEMRKLLSVDSIANNMACLSEQFNRYLSLESISGILVNNADWLLGIHYIEFLRDIGRYFKVNEMIKSEGYRIRLELEQGLSFIEFNYQLLQAYDFLYLYKQYGCKVQLGGNDQWGNILAGVDLTKKKEGAKVFALTFPLITTASGQKMGKTEKGAVWLDPKKTSPYDFYQYWIQCDDRDVIRFLYLFTFLSNEQIELFKQLKGSDMRIAKERLAFEATLLCHGEAEATKALETSRAIFSKGLTSLEKLPTTKVEKVIMNNSGIPLTELLVTTGLATSKSEARRLILQKGITVNDTVIDSADIVITISSFTNGVCVIRRGKKQYHQLVME